MKSILLLLPLAMLGACCRPEPLALSLTERARALAVLRENIAAVSAGDADRVEATLHSEARHDPVRQVNIAIQNPRFIRLSPKECEVDCEFVFTGDGRKSLAGARTVLKREGSWKILSTQMLWRKRL